MTQQIIIEGDLVRLVTITEERAVSLTNWLPSIERRVPVHAPTLPRATRALWYDPTENAHHKMAVMMEVEPNIVHLNKSGTIHALMMPWTRFVFYCTNRSMGTDGSWRMDDYKVFWAKNRYADPEARDMIRALLPNVYNDGRICFGSTGADANQTIANRLDQTANEFYASEFNNDLTIEYPNGWRGFRAWATATARDPLGWMNWPDFTNGVHATYSWNSLLSEWATPLPSRFSPVISADPIPPLAMEASFGRVSEWIEFLSPSQRGRLLLALDQTTQRIDLNNTEEDDESNDEEEF